MPDALKTPADIRTHPNVPVIDQSDRTVPVNLRQSGSTPVQMLISTRVRKSPFWHLSVEAGAWRATVYNRMYHPRQGAGCGGVRRLRHHPRRDCDRAEAWQILHLVQ